MDCSGPHRHVKDRRCRGRAQSAATDGKRRVAAGAGLAAARDRGWRNEAVCRDEGRWPGQAWSCRNIGCCSWRLRQRAAVCRPVDRFTAAWPGRGRCVRTGLAVLAIDRHRARREPVAAAPARGIGCTLAGCRRFAAATGRSVLSAAGPAAGPRYPAASATRHRDPHARWRGAGDRDARQRDQRRRSSCGHVA